MSPRQLYEKLIGAVDAAAADAKKNMQLTGQAAPELSYTVESYADMLKQEASSSLKVGACLTAWPHVVLPSVLTVHRDLALSCDLCWLSTAGLFPCASHHKHPCNLVPAHSHPLLCACSCHAHLCTLQVSPYVLDTPDPQRTKQRLACKLMMALNLDNCVPGLDWTALHPALGVPLLHEMIASGHADKFGMPVFQQQPKQPFELGVAGYHELIMQRPRFVGRWVAWMI